VPKNKEENEGEADNGDDGKEEDRDWRENDTGVEEGCMWMPWMARATESRSFISATEIVVC
jgi:hypothetical protein